MKSLAGNSVYTPSVVNYQFTPIAKAVHYSKGVSYYYSSELLKIMVKSQLTTAFTRLPTARIINHPLPEKALVQVRCLAGPAVGEAEALAGHVG